MNEKSNTVLAEELFAAMEPLLKEGRSAAFTVSGMSMWPCICHNRDSVIIRAADPEHIKVGDIVLFKPVEGKYILHRVTAIKEDSIETTGDGNCFRDGVFPRTCIVAVAEKIIRKGHEIDCGDPKWRLFFRVWMVLYPVRRTILRTLLYMGKIKVLIRKLKK